MLEAGFIANTKYGEAHPTDRTHPSRNDAGRMMDPCTSNAAFSVRRSACRSPHHRLLPHSTYTPICAILKGFHAIQPCLHRDACHLGEEYEDAGLASAGYYMYHPFHCRGMASEAWNMALPCMISIDDFVIPSWRDIRVPGLWYQTSSCKHVVREAYRSASTWASNRTEHYPPTDQAHSAIFSGRGDLGSSYS